MRIHTHAWCSHTHSHTRCTHTHTHTQCQTQARTHAHSRERTRLTSWTLECLGTVKTPGIRSLRSWETRCTRPTWGLPRETKCHLPENRTSSPLVPHTCSLASSFSFFFCCYQERDAERCCFLAVIKSCYCVRGGGLHKQTRWMVANWCFALRFCKYTFARPPLAYDRAKLCDSRFWDTESDSVRKRLQHE